MHPTRSGGACFSLPRAFAILCPLIFAPAAFAQCDSAKCHVGIEPMHISPAAQSDCVVCHGGRADTTDKLSAHVAPHNRALFSSTANPSRSYAALNQEPPEFVRFINPGDLRIADQTCGKSNCHAAIVTKVRSSMMTHGAFLWGAALYNNGAFPLKRAVFGESYSRTGVSQKLTADPAPTPVEMKLKGWLPELWPLPQFEATQPGNTLRVFERGDDRLSNRGFGTLTRTDPVFQGLQRTRLFDPLLYFLGTNDQPGDYRSSGCTACHVVYANDRDPAHSGHYAASGHLGYSSTADPTIKKNEEGHPIQHRLTRSIPSSQCVVCHIHPGTSYASQYYGYMWWDNETDGDRMYPAKTKTWKPADAAVSLLRNPEAASLKGNWSDPAFLRNVRDVNKDNKQTQFADFNGHGWIYRAVYKHDRKGNWLDKDDNKVDFKDPQKFDKAVHLADIHLDKGMHCVDCHFEQDSHGDGHLYGEARAAVEVDCVDCHGSIRARATLKTSNSAAPDGGRDLSILRTPFGTRRFEYVGGKLIQRSMMEENVEWPVSQVLDSITPGSANYNEKARLAKTIQRDGGTWGSTGGSTAAPEMLAHSDERMSCYACHTSWMTSCFGCHLSMKSNANRTNLHNEGDEATRNYTSYNFQVLRDDVFMLGLDSTAKKNKIAPVRSSSAVVVSSQNANREWIYHQEQTISSEGYSGQAFNPHYPHTVRTKETRTCTDCHVSRENDNNAWMAQLLLQGTSFVNFLGRYAYVGEGGHGFEAVAVTEHDEPQAVIGSYLHKLAYPENFARFAQGRQLTEAYEHGGNTLSLQQRGEYLYAAKGNDGVAVYDIANIDNKGFAERVVTAPVSPIGQRFSVKTKDARWIASPTTLAVDPARRRNPENEEQPIHLLYAFLYVADAQEGLILINAATLLDGDPRNNFLKPAVTFNPDGVLNGATFVVTAGNYAYVSCDRGVVIVNIDNPMKPEVVSVIPLKGAGHTAIQFRYLFALDAEGLKVIDITDVKRPAVKTAVPLTEAHDIYIARTYAYVAAGAKGLGIIDVERPEQPGTPKFCTLVSDARAVRIGMTNASAFAYVADGRNGLRILQLMSPARTEGLWGFSPEPEPELIATYKTKGEAIALSKGLDRDRAVDESGNQLAVFGRRGARPFRLDEMQKLYLRNGQLYTVTNTPPGRPQ
ncbi:MAG TPA: hypothetical protein VNY05_33650 [Candidatus Acidoferrales bacterium]|jgi:hypothetical protein|nr:hypothetical protein [Candidatus Acidoferrales bacterium]